MSIRIMGAARERVDDVIKFPDDPEDPIANPISYLETLDNIEHKLIQDSDCHMTRACFEVATQDSHEDLQAWHNHIRFLWLQVNNDKGMVNAETNGGLIHKFLVGKTCMETKKRTWDTIPQTLDDTLMHTLNVRACIDIFVSPGSNGPSPCWGPRGP